MLPALDERTGAINSVAKEAIAFLEQKHNVTRMCMYLAFERF